MISSILPPPQWKVFSLPSSHTPCNPPVDWEHNLSNRALWMMRSRLNRTEKNSTFIIFYIPNVINNFLIDLYRMGNKWCEVKSKGLKTTIITVHFVDPLHFQSGHPNLMLCFPSPDRPIFLEKEKKKSRITCKEASTLIYKHTILSY